MPTATLNSNRPANFALSSNADEDDDGFLSGGGRQQSLLLPGEVRSPGLRPTPLIGDWVRGDTDYWDTSAGTKDQDGKQQPSCTPLNSYGRETLWTVPLEPAAAQQTHDEPQQHSRHSAAASEDDVVAQIQSTISQAVAAAAFDLVSQHPHPHHLHHHERLSEHQHQIVMTTSVEHHDGHTMIGRGSSMLDQSSSGGGGGGVSFSAGGALGSRQSSTDGQALLMKFRSQSEILSEELYHQAKTFPPPPPPNPPGETRRTRAELWYLTARKWDITQQMAPPPRSPLPGMEEERLRDLPELTRVPYRGDRWLAQSDRWFFWVQEHFEYPSLTNTAVHLPTDVVLSLIA